MRACVEIRNRENKPLKSGTHLIDGRHGVWCCGLDADTGSLICRNMMMMTRETGALQREHGGAVRPSLDKARPVTAPG